MGPETKEPSLHVLTKRIICIVANHKQQTKYYLFLRLFWHQVINQKPPLRACPVVPGFAFLCRRRSHGGADRDSVFENGHRRGVSQRDGVNSLDNHVHILLHRTGLAKSFDSFQERDAVSHHNSRTTDTAQSIRGCDLPDK